MHYTVYRTTNLVNGKQYIGSHVTEDVNDCYVGSGKLLRRALLKYGVENFRKEVLASVDSAEEMFKIEAALVDEAYVASPATYNLKVGGDGGWDFINRTGINNSGARPTFSEMARIREEKYRGDNDFETRRRVWTKQGGQKAYESKVGIFGVSKEVRDEWDAAACIAAQSPESRAKRIESFSRNGHSKGEKNSQYGTCWVKNNLTGDTKRIKKDELDRWASEGWTKGRLDQKRRG